MPMAPTTVGSTPYRPLTACNARVLLSSKAILGSSGSGDARAGKRSYGWQMGFLRHRSDDPVGERVLMRQKLLSIGGDLWMQNDQGGAGLKGRRQGGPPTPDLRPRERLRR